uniref:Putative ovule protein n=1 Tax=Solanum chacoense TaxID=4108 RepID=A0A0V0HUF4_SOLCH
MTLLSIDSISLSSVTIIADYYQLDEYGKCKLKISCPNLKFLNYEAPIPKDIIIENLLSIEDVSIVVTIIQDTEIFVHKMIKEVSSTSALTLCSYSILGMYKATSKGSLSLVSLYKLKTLKLYARVDGDFMQAMILLLKYSPNLEVLQLWCLQYNGGSRMHDVDESVGCLESHLKSIRLTNFKGVENEIKLVKFFLMNARVLEKLTIIWDEYPDKSEEALVEVLKFPTTSSQVVLTFLDAKPQPSSCKWYDRKFKITLPRRWLFDC